jgi:hypothetical protein
MYNDCSTYDVLYCLSCMVSYGENPAKDTTMEFPLHSTHLCIVHSTLCQYICFPVQSTATCWMYICVYMLCLTPFTAYICHFCEPVSLPFMTLMSPLFLTNIQCTYIATYWYLCYSVSGNQFSTLFIFPCHKIIISLLYLIEKTVVNTVRCMNVPQKGVNLGPGWLCFQVDIGPLPPIT